MRSLAIAEREGALFSARPPRPAIERLQMAQDTYHQPVLEREIVEFFARRETGVVVDATLGGGGHAAALLAASASRRVIGIDRDPGELHRRDAAAASISPPSAPLPRPLTDRSLLTASSPTPVAIPIAASSRSK